MERLTTNKPVDEMSMLELVYNSCYVDEDGSAMYRDFETVRNARDFVRNLYKVHLNEEMPTDDDVFDESMIDELQYEPEEHLYGLIALFYRNLWAMADLRETLKAYEDKQEQGLLKILPCGIGADVYIIPSETNFRLNLLHGYEENNRVYHQQVESILIHEHGWYIRGDKDNKYGTGRLFLDRFYKETWFLTEAEAESALAKMGGK